LITTTRHITPTRGVPVERLHVLYSMCDVKLTCTSGEGWGLTTMEAMACGLPSIAPDFAALGEWAGGAARMIEAPLALRHCGSRIDDDGHGHGINTVGRVPRVEDAAEALEDLYRHPWLRDELRARGLALVQEERFRWEAIALQFDQVLRSAIDRSGDDHRP